MKTKRLFLIGLVLAVAGTAYAANILKVQDVELVPGESVALHPPSAAVTEASR